MKGDENYVRDLIRRNQAYAYERQALIAAFIEGEQSGVSARRVPDILSAIKQEIHNTPDE